MLHYIIKRGKKEVRAFYLNPMSFSLFLFDFSSANLFEQLLWVNDFFNLRSFVSTIACQTIRIHDQRPQHIHSYPVPIVESILSTSQCRRYWYDIEFTSSSSFSLKPTLFNITMPTCRRYQWNIVHWTNLNILSNFMLWRTPSDFSRYTYEPLNSCVVNHQPLSKTINHWRDQLTSVPYIQISI